ncbi:hypothetical protein Ahy_A08g039762 isoform D [Arachis hypogaea]|uniref:Uncharacterized protein n=1 Tax=Arachis hypogaea TaxID=3818 RepID=A0A445BX82_ARAHY|nr:hypothetical protein Ahy_A08g039762 isoform D [Arachis hypogaea]
MTTTAVLVPILLSTRLLLCMYMTNDHVTSMYNIRHLPPPPWATCYYKFITHMNTPASLQ